jgi:murein DD-endopeptidase MepM/ murein hydrolase activator NlpD
LDWPTYEPATLAPFPIGDSDPTQPAQSGYPASFSAPLALAPHDHFYFSPPVANIDLGAFTPSQRYGVIQEAGDPQIPDPHLGLDIGLDAGTPVRAAAAGTVVWAGYGLLYNSENYIDDPYGISVAIRHDFGYDGERLYTVYAHLREVKVEKGDRVASGDVIGASGSTGLSTGPHLHFEVRSGLSNVYHTRNPELWLTPPQGYGVLVGRVTTSRNVLLLNKLIEIHSVETGRLLASFYSYSTPYKLLSDVYYKENAVLSNLAAGRYEVAIPYYGIWYRTEVEIKPGAITYFHFEGTDGYSFELPAEEPLVGLPN